MSTISAAPATTPSGRDRSGGPLGWWWNGIIHRVRVRDEIRLEPFHASPQHDHGYDVSDHLMVHAEYGDPAPFDGVIPGARRQDIEATVDVVPSRSDAEEGETLPANSAAGCLLEEMS